MNINFNTLKEEFLEKLDENKFGVLATSVNDRVSARTMSIVNIGLKIYMQTHQDFLKYKQIKKNGNIALCFNNTQIEGIARITGSPFNEKNQEFLEMYKKFHNGSFDMYTKLEGVIVIEIDPKIVSFWKYIDAIPYVDRLYLDEKKAVRQKQKISKT
ncbi:pyridoxamine 5'-phosphate oxidase family protein [Natronospora cellulosivora (SeqCode)]